MVSSLFRLVLKPSNLISLVASLAVAYWGLDYVKQPVLLTFGSGPIEVGKLEDGDWIATDEAEIGKATTVRFPDVRRNPGYHDATWIFTRNLYGECGSAQLDQMQAPDRVRGSYEVFVRFEVPSVFQPGLCCYQATASVYKKYNPLHRFLGPLKVRTPEVCFRVVEAEMITKELKVEKLHADNLQIIEREPEGAETSIKVEPHGAEVKIPRP